MDEACLSVEGDLYIEALALHLLIYLCPSIPLPKLDPSGMSLKNFLNQVDQKNFSGWVPSP